MLMLEKRSIVAEPCEKKERVVVELDKILATIAFDESIFDQLNTLRDDENRD